MCMGVLHTNYILRPEDEETDAALLDRRGDVIALLLLPPVLGPLVLDMVRDTSLVLLGKGALSKCCPYCLRQHISMKISLARVTEEVAKGDLCNSDLYKFVQANEIYETSRYFPHSHFSARS